MNFFEVQIERLGRLVTRMDANPNPARLRTNKTFYELELELRQAQLAAWQAGKPFAYFPYQLALPYAMGFQSLPLYQGANRQTSEAAKLISRAQNFGLPEQGCDTTLVGTAMCLGGDMPMPAVLFIHGVCDPIRLSQMLLAEWFDVPYFPLDVCLDRDEPSLTYLNHQLEELISFAKEKVPGIRYDEERLTELQEVDRVGYGYYRDVYELKKKSPCPMNARDAFRNCPLPHEYPDPWKFVGYLRTLRDELADRVASNQQLGREEKMRVMWTVAAPLFWNPFAVLDRLGVSMPIFYVAPVLFTYGINIGSYGDVEEYGRRLSPLEEEARLLNYGACAGKGNRWVDNAIQICQDLRIDAIVNYNQVGCTATLGLGTLLKQRAERDLGIPTLQLHGRTLEDNRNDQGQMDSLLETFVKLWFERKMPC